MLKYITYSLHIIVIMQTATQDQSLHGRFSLSEMVVCSDLVVQITELLHQVLGNPFAPVGLVVSHAVLGVQADAADAPFSVCGVLQQSIFLCQVIHRVTVGTMDPGSS